MPFRSAPAQNARPVPVMMATHRLGSASNHCHSSASSALPSELMQFKDLGRFKRTSRISGVGYVSTRNLVAGGWVFRVDAMVVGESSVLLGFFRGGVRRR